MTYFMCAREGRRIGLCSEAAILQTGAIGGRCTRRDCVPDYNDDRYDRWLSDLLVIWLDLPTGRWSCCWNARHGKTGYISCRY